MEDKHEGAVNGSTDGTEQTVNAADADGHSAGSQEGKNPAESSARWLAQLSEEVRSRVEGPEGFSSLSEYVASLLDRIGSGDANTPKGGDPKQEGGNGGTGDGDGKAWDERRKPFLEKGKENPDAVRILDELRTLGVTPEQSDGIWKAFADAGERRQKAAGDAAKRDMVSYVSETFGTQKEKVDAGLSLIGRGFQAFAKESPDAYISADRKGLTRTPEFMEMARRLALAGTDGGSMQSVGGGQGEDPSDPFRLL